VGCAHVTRPVAYVWRVIEVQGLTKRFGSKTVVDNLSFRVEDGTVTGFLGPNGAGKSTTMRCMLALDRPAAGRMLFNGKEYADLAHPLREVGALLDAKYVHPSRTARNHLRYLAASNGLAKSRVDEVLETVGMTSVADQKVGKFSLGMHQRLGIAVAILGDPHTMLFDEPVNGLDPEGIVWVRTFMRYLASQGRTVLVSSHLLSEMAVTADNLVVIGQGKLISAGSVSQFVSQNVSSWVSVRSPQAASMTSMLAGIGATVKDAGPGALAISGVTPEQVGELAARHGIVLHELVSRTASLEEAFMEATRSSVEYHASALPGSGYPTSSDGFAGNPPPPPYAGPAVTGPSPAGPSPVGPPAGLSPASSSPFAPPPAAPGSDPAGPPSRSPLSTPPPHSGTPTVPPPPPSGWVPPPPATSSHPEDMS
jgi:ABC-2 type transport system ATP-binding protein